MRRTPDVVVVGAGAAGAALAARLSEDPDRGVLLLESGPVPAGPDAFGPALLDARLVPGAQPDHPGICAYPVRLMSDRPWTVPRGRLLGGSTTVNGGYFVRARREDFARWAAAGNPAWSAAQVLPFLRALETDLDFGTGAVHGDRGPMAVRRATLDHPAAAAFQDAALAAGFPTEPDKNDDARPGFGPVPSNSVHGVRRNTALSYLPPHVITRPNFTLLSGCHVTRVLVEHGRATGVVARYGGTRTVIDAGEVVLSAGAFASAHLLLLSGIGPRADLERLGIPVLRDAPAVGTRFSDHPQLVLEWSPRRELGAPRENWLGGCLHLPSGVGRSGAPDGPGDLEILQSLIPMAGLTRGEVSVPGAPLAFLVSAQAPRPTGRLRLVSADPAVLPRIDQGMLSTPDDHGRLRAAVRATAALMSTPPLTGLSDGLLGLPPAVLDVDSALDTWIAGRLATAQHTCGTVPMGPADEPGRSAVDQYGRVHGTRSLRVADTSILPDAPHRGPAATAVLVGEVIADAIRRDLP
ncbi:GMC family oxidoreductase [Streptomyces sp. NPDC087903]|uniref:GMC family oxidoreductase n=1 Tax=Streptomyces sp. NPDC087903 TaxID=3365819 RepID=UPI003826CD2C